MHYTVQARLIPGTAADLLLKLTDGTVAAQKPYGKEVVASMKRAVIDEDGVGRWSEGCYCPTPPTFPFTLRPWNSILNHG